MKLAQLFDRMDLAAEFADREIHHLTDDSRRVQEGSLFVARTGSQKDGVHFIAEAKSKGAAFVLGALGSGADLEVPELHDVLPELLERFYGNPTSNLCLNAVTGTNGKTTTAFLLHQVLQNWTKESALTGTVCQRLGDEEVPSQLTTPGLFDFYALLSRVSERKLKYLNFEASSHALDQGRLGHLKVETAIFTNLSQDHLDYHGSLDAYFEAKLKLFTQHLSPTGRAIVNIDNPWGLKLSKQCSLPLWTTSLRTSADFRLTLLGGSLLRPVYKIVGSNLDIEVETLLPGEFNRENILGVVAALHHLGVPADQIQKHIAQVTVPGRLQKIPHPRLHVFVDYAHTPDALERVLASLRPLCSGKLITVFGCGGDRDAGKRPLMARAAEALSDRVFITSDNPRTEDPQKILNDVLTGIKNRSRAVVQIDRRLAIEQAIAELDSMDVLLIAGKGHEDYQIIGTTKYPFDDRLIAAQALETK